MEFIYTKLFGFSYDVKLATRPAESMGASELWEKAEKQLVEALNAKNVPWTLKEGDGAFYGPKIDI